MTNRATGLTDSALTGLRAQAVSACWEVPLGTSEVSLHMTQIARDDMQYDEMWQYVKRGRLDAKARLQDPLTERLGAEPQWQKSLARND